MQPTSMRELWQGSYLAAGNEYLENLYETYLNNPESVSPTWRQYFDQLSQQTQRTSPEVSHAAVREAFSHLTKNPINTKLVNMPVITPHHEQQQERVVELIGAYRRLGHLQANTDPLGLQKTVYHPLLELAYYGFSDKDLKTDFNLGSFSSLNKPTATITELHQALRQVYCRTIGFEYMHINRTEEVEWIRERIEKGWANFHPTDEEKKTILKQLVAADGLEKYLGFKYVGQKRFSLEGGDALIPFLDKVVDRCTQAGVKEMVIGMAHRGRLNVLVNVVGKDPKAIFAGFEGIGISQTHSGDVKYHLGYSSNVKTSFGNLHVALAFNPSHLEIVSPVAQGSVRARQRRRRDTGKAQVLPIQIHGDAAFAGQGVVMETFNMSQARWFTVGGSIHIVINNQVGFTTSDPQDARSTLYCTDVAKMVEPPILHVNANDPEAVYFAAQFAFDYRHTFKRDVVIDLVCYRRHGHNEADEPSATQPLMYKKIKDMPPLCVSYAEALQQAGLIGAEAEKKLEDDYRQGLDAGNAVIETVDNGYEYNINWETFANQKWDQVCETGVPLKQLQALGNKLAILPDQFVVQPQVKKILDAQNKMITGEIPLNWGYAEKLAYATLLEEGYPIRLCGQDAARGTFAHRHAVLHDQNTDEIYIPLSHLSNGQAQINIVDSLLSEEAVLAFEYGYATAEPNFLVIWEAQFGDFANGAQVVIDQFISSGELKWERLCGLVMLLPHGYEGQGPEHSSARLERYLQLCAQDNMQVCVPTTPAQIFHLLRRQMKRPYRKPLIIMSPKSMLRSHLAVSALTELTEGQFKVIFPEIDDLTPAKVEKMIVCSGKVYYDLLEYRREQKRNDTAIIRIEQLYPFPEKAWQAALATYPKVKKVVWCQEEPQNQGAWASVASNLTAFLNKGQTLHYAGRQASASPAVGYYSVHEKEQKELVIQAFKI